MRVIAGTARRLLLKTPEGMDTRPTTDRIKETLFNMIQGDIPGSIFVDLFSGSGGIGIEALSRGARFEDKATLLKQDAVSALSLISEKEVDIVFMDPPYQLQVERNVFSALKQQKYITEDTLIITEAALDRDFSFVEELGFTIVREKRYKTNKHVFCRKAAQ